MRATALAAAAGIGIALAAPVAAQQVSEQRVNEFWPELNVQRRLDERSRLVFIGSIARARDYASATESNFGVHYDRFAVPLPGWWRDALPGMERRWSLGYRVGYNHISAWGDGRGEHRFLADVGLRSEPLLAGLQLANRSRFEYRDLGSDISWRFRNRTRVERGFSPAELLGERLAAPVSDLGVGGIVPYATLEYFYDSRFSAWRRRSQQYGVELDLPSDRSLDLFVGIQDDLRVTRSRVVAVGVTLTLRY